MTLTELKSITGSQLRILVAEADGWTQLRTHLGGVIGMPPSHVKCDTLHADTWLCWVTDYTNDRDAIVDAIKRRLTTEAEKQNFTTALYVVFEAKSWSTFTIATASAEDLCRAFLAALKGEK